MQQEVETGKGIPEKRKIAISTGNQHLLNQKMMLVTGKLLLH